MFAITHTAKYYTMTPTSNVDLRDDVVNALFDRGWGITSITNGYRCGAASPQAYTLFCDIIAAHDSDGDFTQFRITDGTVFGFTHKIYIGGATLFQLIASQCAA